MWPQQQQRPLRLARREAEALARLEIEILRAEPERDGDGARTQSLLDRPEGFRVIAGLDQRDTPGIEAERLQPMAINPAGGGEALL